MRLTRYPSIVGYVVPAQRGFQCSTRNDE
jgi:hypothetical protein